MAEPINLGKSCLISSFFQESLYSHKQTHKLKSLKPRQQIFQIDQKGTSVHVSDMMTKTKAERAKVLGIKKT